MIRQKSIGKFSECVCIEQSRANKTELHGVKNTRIHQWFLDHVQCQATDISQSIAQGYNEHDVAPEILVLLVDNSRIFYSGFVRRSDEKP